ncbi:histidine kinase [Sphaerisporangium rufum]|uniref:histidine kinase n=1 Tax=Sphaerisporangium rufum TaxID=1381558 RepID=A0A919V0P1_9ACTN|nr:histidine kinase [Sphaerisporangium rufum]GII80291.1 histidine kinase [Sphaerisporangium rufum]
MRIPVVVVPLVSGATYRRGVHLLLGGVLLLPYLMTGVAFARMFAVPRAPYGLLALVLALAVAVGAVPPFLRGTRALEITAARSLLGVPLPDPPPVPERSRAARETRVRAALWFAVHLATGGVVGALVSIPAVLGVVLAVQWFGLTGDALAGLRLGPLDEHDSAWLALLGIAMVVGVIYAVAGLGALAAVMAPVLLGPSPAERIAALEARAAELAERNRLARELHDSIGHALTVTTLQAAAALQVLDRDPAFARQALAAIEDTGRAAAADLDRVLGMLREGGPPASHHTLADLDGLAGHSRGTGMDVRTEIRGELSRLPAPVSREGYRIVQESLTNALRHAGPVPVTVRVTVEPAALVIDVANPLRIVRRGGSPARSAAADGGMAGGAAVDGEMGGGEADGGLARVAPPEGGRGLAGMRERVTLLGGAMTAGPDGRRWRVAVRLPVPAPAGPGDGDRRDGRGGRDARDGREGS